MMYMRLKGLTLMESIVYIALFSLIFIVIIQFSLSIAENNRNAGDKTEIERVSIFLFEHLETTVEDSSGIDTTNSVFNDDSGVLRLNDGSGGYSEYSISDGRLSLSNGSSSDFLTTGGFYITRFHVEELQIGEGETAGVRVSIEIVSEEDSKISRVIESSFLLDNY